MAGAGKNDSSVVKKHEYTEVRGEIAGAGEFIQHTAVFGLRLKQQIRCVCGGKSTPCAA